MHPMLKKLEGGDRRSIGRSNEVVTEVLSDPALFPALIEGLSVESPVVRMRAADALEKVTAKHPEYLMPYKRELLDIAKAANQKEVQWHMAQMLPRLDLSADEKLAVIQILEAYLTNESSIVRTCVMQAFADLAESDALLKPALIARIKSLAEQGTPAMKARGRKLLAKLQPKEYQQG